MSNPRIFSFPIPAHLNYVTLVYRANLSIQSPSRSLEQARICRRNESRGLAIQLKAMSGVLESLSLNLLSEKPHGERTFFQSYKVNFSDGGVLELLQQIVNEPPPKLPEGKDYRGMDSLIERCLVKAPDKRPRPEELMVTHLTLSCVNL